MKVQLIRNATLRLTYGGRQILIDPMLGEKHSIRSFAGISPNPTVDLPCPPQEVLEGVEMVMISHLHPDHFDQAAQEMLPKELPLFCQPGDETKIVEMGFRQVTAVVDSVEWEGIHITRTPGQHGTGELAERMGYVSGFIFQAENEPVVYWAGDTIWYEEVEKVLDELKPDLVITHSGGPKFGDSDPILMDAGQTMAVCGAAPQAMVVAVHLEALDHCTVSRVDLRKLASERDILQERLFVPADGEEIEL